ncbi:MAG: LysM peptidoglycan-binding domain-containing protein [Bacteroidota bacterium]
MNKTLRAVSLISLFTVTISSAQVNPMAAQTAIVPEYDPIVSMLDSLVTLNNVIRYSSIEGNCFDKNSANCIIPSFSDEVISQRMSAINSPIPLSNNKYVKEFISLYAEKKRSLTQRVMGLSNFYFPLFEETLDKEGLPLEFKYLSVVESALNPVAVSRVGATGLWQFMYNTGTMYDLKVNSNTDERRDPIKATHAACKYFKDMYAIYGDWLLVIASYNCGPGNVNRAIKRSGGKTNFWEIMPYLPKETRGYVPAFIAVTYVMNYSREHNLYPVVPAYNFFQVDTIAVSRQVNFKVLSNQLDLPLDVISYLNPVYKKNLIPAKEDVPMTLRLPTNKIAQFISLEESIYASSAPAAMPVLPQRVTNKNDDLMADATDGNFEYTVKKIKKTHTVKRGETLGAIANRYDMTSAQLKKLNHLKSTKVAKGQRLSVYTFVKVKTPVKQNNVARIDTAKASKTDTSLTASIDENTDSVPVSNVDSDDANNAKKTGKNQPGEKKFVYHLVQPGDTLWNIARRYEGVTVEQIKDMNNLHNSNLKVGTKLKLKVNNKA